MGITQSRSGGNLLIVLLLACLCCSCAHFDANSHEDYIGPQVPEDREQRTADSNTPNPQSAIRNPQFQEGPLRVTVRQATLLALENNRSLVLQRLDPQITRTFEQEQLAVFDPVATGRLAYGQDKIDAGPITSDSSGVSAAAGLQERLPSGTSLGVTGSTAPTRIVGLEDDQYESRIAFSATQSLLRGLGSAVNLAAVNQARIDTKISQYELRGFVQALVAQVEQTYWDYALAERQIEIFNQSLELAQRQWEETQERIRVGDVASSELPAAEAEVALRREDLINARSNLAKTKLNLLRLMNPPSTEDGGQKTEDRGPRTEDGVHKTAPSSVLRHPSSGFWDREVVLASLPTSPSITLDDVQSHVALAMRMRPDLNQAKLLWQRGELEVVKTRNGLLPRLDLFVTLGKSGFADSFGRSITDLDGDSYNALVGLNVEYPLGNRAAQARHQRAVLTRRQAQEAIDNLSQLIEVDVRTAYLEIARSQEQVTATAATRRLQEQKLLSETEKFRLGKSTSLLVAQAQRDFTSSQIAEVQAVVNYLKSLVEIYRQEGSLLERRGIAAPGGGPTESKDTP